MASTTTIRPTLRRRRRTGRGRATTLHVVALLLTAMYLIPLLYIIMVSLTPTHESTIRIPSHAAFGNYVQAFVSSNFGQAFINSLVVTLIAVVCQVILSCMAGYALAKLPFKSAKNILLLLIGLLVLPPEIIMVPLFVMIAHVPFAGGNDLLGSGGQGLLNSYFALVLPHLVSALGIFLMRQFYVGLPDELGQAARVDGASEWKIFTRIYTPLTLPAVAVVAILAFQGAWNDFLWPLIVVRTNQMQTLQLSVTVFSQEYSTQWNLMMATVLMMSVPILLIFLFAQKLFVSGITTGAVK